MKAIRTLLLLVSMGLLVACSAGASNDAATAGAPESTPNAQSAYDPAAVPTGPLGESIKLGHDIITDTRAKVPQYVTARMSCAACHLDAGTKARAGTFVGVYGLFPQWNKRSHRVIALQDRLAECFLFSMNGRPPAYASKEMIALVSYIAWVSRDVKIGAAPDKAAGFVEPLPQRSPDVHAGATLYAQNCTQCHGANGAGNGAMPPLWGATSFNNGAGMAHIDRMTGFVRYNMPLTKPGSLSQDQAYDIAAFVLSHERPAFDKTRVITQDAQSASFF